MGPGVDKIVIVGGGTAGWMAAAALKRAVGPDGDVTLVESADIGIVGVGEATIPAIRQFNTMIGLDEVAFMKATRGSYKLGIEFVDWGGLGQRYFHPFGVYGSGPDLGGFPQAYFALEARGGAGTLSDYSMCVQAAVRQRMGDAVQNPASPYSQLHSAYHFDAVLYAKHLRGFCERMGVKRVEGEVVNVALRGEDGFVESITLKDGRVISGELFIDCTGFRGLLIEGALQTGYEHWDRWLPMDRAVAVPCAKVAGITPYTRSTAREAGWQWRIPLQHRTGNGYVFSSKFISEDEATAVLLRNLDGEVLAEPRVLRFHTGRRRKLWNKNVVALGLASGFIEPLESTSIHMIQSGLVRLLQHFPDKTFDPVNIEVYNSRAIAESELIRDFIILHYHVTGRDDAPMWNEVRTMSVPDRLKERIDIYRHRGLIVSSTDELFSQSSWLAVLHGQAGPPKAHNPLYERGAAKSEPQMAAMRAAIAQAADKLLDHEAYLARRGMTEAQAA